MPAPDIVGNLDVFTERFILPAGGRDVHIISWGESVSSSYRWPPTGSLEPQVGDAFRKVLLAMCGTSGMALTNCADPGGTFSEGLFPLTIEQGGTNWASVNDTSGHPLAWQFVASTGSYTGGSALVTSSATGTTSSAWRPAVENTVAVPATFTPYGQITTLDIDSFNIYWACLASAAGTGDVGIYGANGGDVATAGTFDFTTPLATLVASGSQQAVTKTTVTTATGRKRGLAFRRIDYTVAGSPANDPSVTGMAIIAMSGRAPAAFRRGVRVGCGLSYGGQTVDKWASATCADTQTTIIGGEQPDGILPVFGRNDAGGGATTVANYMTSYTAGMSRALTASPTTMPIVWAAWKADNTGQSLDRINQYSSALYEYAMDNRYPFFDGSQIVPPNTSLFDGGSGHLNAAGAALLTRRLNALINTPTPRSRRPRSFVTVPG